MLDTKDTSDVSALRNNKITVIQVTSKKNLKATMDNICNLLHVAKQWQNVIHTIMPTTFKKMFCEHFQMQIKVHIEE